MCAHLPTFVDNRMYAAFIKGTEEMLIGGGNDRLLPFVSLDPTNKPTQILVDGIMYNVEYRRVKIWVYPFPEIDFQSEGEIVTYNKKKQVCYAVKPNTNIDQAVKKANEISGQRFAKALQDTVNIQ